MAGLKPCTTFIKSSKLHKNAEMRIAQLPMSITYTNQSDIFILELAYNGLKYQFFLKFFLKFLRQEYNHLFLKRYLIFRFSIKKDLFLFLFVV